MGDSLDRSLWLFGASLRVFSAALPCRNRKNYVTDPDGGMRFPSGFVALEWVGHERCSIYGDASSHASTCQVCDVSRWILRIYCDIGHCCRFKRFTSNYWLHGCDWLVGVYFLPP